MDLPWIKVSRPNSSQIRNLARDRKGSRLCKVERVHIIGHSLHRILRLECKLIDPCKEKAMSRTLVRIAIFWICLSICLTYGIATPQIRRSEQSQSLIFLWLICHTNKAINGKTDMTQLLSWAAQATWKSNRHNTLKIYRAQQLTLTITTTRK